jgi:hypothetical protein
MSLVCILPGPSETVRTETTPPKWCFYCRTRVPFVDTLNTYSKDSPNWGWYEPTWQRRCSNCRAIDGDLFPGYERNWGDE